ncbi:unnamed protein product [Clonostachys byssicola]|uniref:Gamma-glutamyltranspeptidase n=1 Tax=Clonostachys byssicola TaxID=160290 RepID=A0A9N9TYY9_9HYPO|nr:unnamed protein product [Clonostachys byssicola]
MAQDRYAGYPRFPGRRSVVHSANGMVACTQPLAAEAGQRILKMGGNAADAAIAVAAAMNVTEPASTGLGGDMFCLYFDAATAKVSALNGSGRSAKNSSLARVKNELGLTAESRGKIPINSPLAVTVPGAAAGWVDAFERFGSGKLTLAQVLDPAIELADDGFPVSEISAHMWKTNESDLKKASDNYMGILKQDESADGQARAPRAGEIFRNPDLAKTLRTLASEGKEGFYKGWIAKAIVDTLKDKGSHLELSDLEDHTAHGTEAPEAISLKFGGFGVGSDKDKCVELWEHPPNGQGIVALMALGILEQLERAGKIPTFGLDDHNTSTYLHAVIEALRIAFADAVWWVTDPETSPISPAQMISPEYLATRAKLFNSDKAGVFSESQFGPSPAQNHSDTVYFAVTDRDGNAMSFINSVFREFGSGIVPTGCGFTLQNRGGGFDLGPEDHPNIYAGGKRPYHTIIPGLVTHGDGAARQLGYVYGVMGGLMQPQGHVQVLLNTEVFKMNPQQAIDAPRICIAAAVKDQPTVIFVEDGISEGVVEELRAKGHDIKVMKEWARVWFGRGQIIKQSIDKDSGKRVYHAGSDGRGDGLAMPV